MESTPFKPAGLGYVMGSQNKSVRCSGIKHLRQANESFVACHCETMETSILDVILQFGTFYHVIKVSRGSNDTQPRTRKFTSFSVFLSYSINTTVKGYLNITAIERLFVCVSLRCSNSTN